MYGTIFITLQIDVLDGGISQCLHAVMEDSVIIRRATSIGRGWFCGLSKHTIL